MFITRRQQAVLAGLLVAFIAAAKPVKSCAGSKCKEEGHQDSDVLLQIAVNHSADWGMFNHAKGPPKPIKTLHPYYHTGAEIRAKVEVEAMSKDCGGALRLETVSEKDTHIDVVNVRKPGSTPVNKVFILFGEHSRELISPESALRLLEVICGKANVEGKEDLAPSVLLDSEFQLVLSANPRSRSKVEQGEYCMRANPEGTDINRNWDEMWSNEMSDPTGSNSGTKPFSAPETRIVKSLVSKYKPTTFLTVHSGTRGMFMPWYYDQKHAASRNAPLMLQILKDLDKDHCQCPFGAGGKEIGYSCPGTSLDWVYDKLKTPYTFAFEIFVGQSKEDDDALNKRWEKLSKQPLTSLLQSESHLGHEHFAELFKMHASDFVHTRQQDSMNLEDKIKNMGDNDNNVPQAWCFNMFNPKTEAKYHEVVQNWAVAYLEMAQKVASDIKMKRIQL